MEKWVQRFLAEAGPTCISDAIPDASNCCTALKRHVSIENENPGNSESVSGNNLGTLIAEPSSKCGPTQARAVSESGRFDAPRTCKKHEMPQPIQRHAHNSSSRQSDQPARVAKIRQEL